MLTDKLRLPRVLYFIEGPMPSKEQIEESLNMRADVSFRNASVVPHDPTAKPEECDAVAGEVPEIYKVFPMFKKDAELEDLEKEKAKLTEKAKKEAEKAPAIPKTPTAWKAGA